MGAERRAREKAAADRKAAEILAPKLLTARPVHRTPKEYVVGSREVMAEDIRRGDRRRPKIPARLRKPKKANLRARNQAQLDVLKTLIQED